MLLLLSVGKGLEFKGKSLAEIEVTDDILECEQEEEVEKEWVNNDLKEEYEERQPQENNVTEENFEKKRNLSHITEEYQANEETQPAKIKKGNRVRWANTDKQLVLKHFKKHIEKKISPRKNECLNFIHNNSELFSESDWVRIKTLVFNTYHKK